jgi:hypothetical protein
MRGSIAPVIQDPAKMDFAEFPFYALG